AGFLAEATEHGPPEAGRFWREEFCWPLVWERDLQTAIQPSLGGSKLSCDVRTHMRPYGSKRQWFDLAATGEEDVERLIALGATEIERRDTRIVMTDPGGNEFVVRS